MLIDLLLDGFSGLVEAVIGALPAFAFDPTPAHPLGGGNVATGWHDLASALVRYNAFVPVREIFVLFGLFGTFLTVMLVVKFIMWIVEIFPGKMS